MNISMYLPLLISLALVRAAEVTHKCPDGLNDDLDYGNLTEPGTGRILHVVGTEFQIFGEKVFLSGIDTLGRHMYFGNNQYAHSKRHYERDLRKVHQAGGNSISTPLNGKGNVTTTLEFDATGRVVGLDKTGSFVSEVRMYLRAAASYSIVVFLTLWDGLHDYHNMHSMITDDLVLQSYIDNALLPLAKAIKDEPGLGGYEILSDLDSYVIKGERNSDACFDTTKYYAGGNQTGRYTMNDLLRFVARQADAIRNVDPTTPVTTGSWNTKFNTDQLGFFNFLKDECMQKAGGKKQGHLTFYTTHASWVQGHYNGNPFTHDCSEYKLDKPLVINKLELYEGLNMTAPDQYNGPITMVTAVPGVTTTITMTT